MVTVLHRMKKQQDQKQASSQNRKRIRFVLPEAYEDYAMQVAAFAEYHGTIHIRPVARIFRRGVTWASNVYVCMHKHGRVVTRGIWGHAPPGNF